MSVQTAADSLSALLSRAQGTLRSRGLVIVAGALVFAASAFLFRGLADVRLEQFRQSLLQEDSVAEDLELLELLQSELQAGNTAVEGEIRDIRDRMSLQLSILSGKRSMWVLLQSPYFLVDAGPFLFMSALVSVLSLIGTFTVAVQATLAADPLRRTLQRTLMLILPMAMLLLAMLLQSLLFLPVLFIILARIGAPLGGDWQVAGIFLGYFVSVMAGPRLLLSPVLFAEDNAGVRTAMRRSWDVSRGYWGKILGNLLALTAGYAVVHFIVTRLLRLLPGSPGIELALARSLLLHFFLAFAGIFLVHLTRTLRDHPCPLPGEKPSDEPSLETRAAHESKTLGFDESSVVGGKV